MQPKSHSASMLQRWGWLTLYMVIGACLLATAMVLAPGAEERYRPVVKDFVVDRIERDGHHVTISGTMSKVRDCRFVELLAYAQAHGDTFWRPVTVDFSPARNTIMSRLPIDQRWGPWSIDLQMASPATVKLAVRHECHGMYPTTTQLATFEVM